MAQLVFYGMSDSTPAARAVFAQALGRRAAPRRRRKASRVATSSRKAKSTRRRAKRPARLVKGSAAAKRYMASIRKKRR